MTEGDARERDSRPPTSSVVPTVPPHAERSLPPPAPPERVPTPARVVATAKKDARAELEARLVRDIVGAERFRTLLLASIATVTLFLVVVQGQEISTRLIRGGFDRMTVEAFLLVVASFELYVLAWSRKLLQADATPHMRRRYLHAFVETSLPTAVIAYYASVDGPATALLMPSSFVYFVFILLSTLGLDPLLCLFTGAVAAGEYTLVALVWGTSDTHVTPASLASEPHHLGKALILLASGIAAAFVASRLRRSFTEAIESFGERTRILGVFGEHVSPEVALRLVASETAQVKSEQRNVCVMFVDIRNFTAFSEHKSAAAVVGYLNTVFDATIDAVLERHGIVNKFLGDGFMAVFGAPTADPNPSRSAIEAALDIVARVEDLVVRGVIEKTTIGIGLHTGAAVVGNIGSEARKEYTVIGDVVNLASRIEALNKAMGSRVLVSEATFDAAGEMTALASAKRHDDVVIRGRTRPIRVWELA